MKIIIACFFSIFSFAVFSQNKKIEPKDTVTYKCGRLSIIEYDGIYFKSNTPNTYFKAVPIKSYSARRINANGGFGPADRHNFPCELSFMWPYTITKLPIFQSIIIKGIKYSDNMIADMQLFKGPFTKDKNCVMYCYYWCDPISIMSTKTSDYFYSFDRSLKIELLLKKIAGNHYQIGFSQPLQTNIDYALCIGSEIIIFRIENNK